MWKILQHEKPDDFVVATGKQFTIKEFVEKCLSYLEFDYKWVGESLSEQAIDKENNVFIEIDPRYFRPAEVDNLLGDSKKAEKDLGWNTKISIDDLVKDMIDSEISNINYK